MSSGQQVVHTERMPWRSEDRCKASPRRPGASARGSSSCLSSWSAAGRWGRSRASRQSGTGGGGWGGRRLWRPCRRPHRRGSSSPGWCWGWDWDSVEQQRSYEESSSDGVNRPTLFMFKFSQNKMAVVVFHYTLTWTEGLSGDKSAIFLKRQLTK